MTKMVAASVNLREVREANTFTSLTFFSIIFVEIILLWISVNAVMIIIATMAKAAINNDIRVIPTFLNNSLFFVPTHKYIDHFKPNYRSIDRQEYGALEFHL